MSNFKNTIALSSTGHDTFPVSQALTGTFVSTSEASTTGRLVVGTGTLFTTEMQGSGSFFGWLCDIAHDEIRRITLITDDTHLELEQAFTNAQSGSVVYVEPSDYVELSVVFAATGKIDGVSFPANVGFSFSKASRDKSGVRDFVDPIIVDATGTTAYLLGVK